MVPVSHRPCNATISVTLPSSNTGWDYVKMEPDSSRLFMARVQDGLAVFDVDTGRVVTTVENSTGDLKTLKPAERKIHHRNTFVVLTYKPE